MSIVGFIPGPDAWEFTGREKSAKFCWTCRRYRVHRQVMLYDSSPSYYEPIFVWDCPCKKRDPAKEGIRRGRDGSLIAKTA